MEKKLLVFLLVSASSAILYKTLKATMMLFFTIVLLKGNLHLSNQSIFLLDTMLLICLVLIVVFLAFRYLEKARNPYTMTFPILFIFFLFLMQILLPIVLETGLVFDDFVPAIDIMAVVAFYGYQKFILRKDRYGKKRKSKS